MKLFAKFDRLLSGQFIFWAKVTMLWRAFLSAAVQLQNQQRTYRYNRSIGLCGAVIEEYRQILCSMIIVSILRKCTVCCAFFMMPVVLMLQVKSGLYYIYVCIYIHIFVWMYVYMCIHIYILEWTNLGITKDKNAGVICIFDLIPDTTLTPGLRSVMWPKLKDLRLGKLNRSQGAADYFWDQYASKEIRWSDTNILHDRKFVHRPKEWLTDLSFIFQFALLSVFVFSFCSVLLEGSISVHVQSRRL